MARTKQIKPQRIKTSDANYTYELQDRNFVGVNSTHSARRSEVKRIIAKFDKFVAKNPNPKPDADGCYPDLGVFKASFGVGDHKQEATYGAYIMKRGGIGIGCMAFSKATVNTLRAWANSVKATKNNVVSIKAA